MEIELEHRIVHALAGISLDYEEQLAFIRKRKKKGENWAPAAVLVLLGRYPHQHDLRNGYFFLLNKRSAFVQQPGDLCFPGGHPNRWIDLLLGRLFVPLVLWINRDSAFMLLRQKDRETFRRVMYFLGNGLRESFEEMRLNPFKVDFLGALYCYRLELFQRVIFPLVGILKTAVRPRLNWEVERIVNIPLSTLMAPDNYAVYRLMVSDKFRSFYPSDIVDYDCFVHRETDGRKEILWGASYQIIQSFLQSVFDFKPPAQRLRPVVEGELYPNIQ
jgi:hypothetical protein